jgi:hypothetical protein
MGKMKECRRMRRLKNRISSELDQEEAKHVVNYKPITKND